MAFVISDRESVNYSTHSTALNKRVLLSLCKEFLLLNLSIVAKHILLKIIQCLHLKLSFVQRNLSSQEFYMKWKQLRI